MTTDDWTPSRRKHQARRTNKKKIAAASKKRWADPAYKARVSKAISDAKKRKWDE